MDEKKRYLIIGGGRLAKHLSAYFDLLNINYLRWQRTFGIPLESELHKCGKILLAVSDNALAGLSAYINSLISSGQTIIHFSGALEIQKSESAHPLMTFSRQLYSEEFYKLIPFITVEGKKKFSELFPELPNPNYQIPAERKVYYHALCSMAGNFPAIIWKKTTEEFQNKLGLPAEAFYSYLTQTLNNFISDNESLTGPFSRRDFSTIDLHREVLKNNELAGLYDSFYELYFSEREAK